MALRYIPIARTGDRISFIVLDRGKRIATFDAAPNEALAKAVSKEWRKNESSLSTFIRSRAAAYGLMGSGEAKNA